MTSHLTPQDLEAEEAILGAIISSSRALEAARMVGLTADDFYRPQHASIYETVMVMAAQGRIADEKTTIAALKRAGKLDEVGGPVAVLDLIERVPSIANAKAYAQQVLDVAKLRAVVGVGHDIAAKAYEGQTEPDELIAAATQQVLNLTEFATRAHQEVQTMRQLAPMAYDHLSDLAAADRSPGVSTGFGELDNTLGGMHPDNLIIVAARPAMGKTAMLLNISANVVRREQRHAMLFSLEMGNIELTLRQLSGDAKVSGGRLRNGRVRMAEWDSLAQSVGAWTRHEHDMYVDQTPALTPAQIRAKATRVHRKVKGGLGFIGIDYLQLMRSDRPSRHGDNRHLELSSITKELKALAKDLHVPVMCLSQLNRGVEQRQDKRPVLSDLRESGAIEEDADSVILLYRPAYYSQHATPQDKEVTEVIVAKNRHDENRTIAMRFEGQYTTFTVGSSVA